MIAYVNIVGGQDELVFDGASCVIDATGSVLAAAPQFEPSLLVVDVDVPDAEGDPRGFAGVAETGTTAARRSTVTSRTPSTRSPRSTPRSCSAPATT